MILIPRGSTSVCDQDVLVKRSFEGNLKTIYVKWIHDGKHLYPLENLNYDHS